MEVTNLHLGLTLEHSSTLIATFPCIQVGLWSFTFPFDLVKKTICCNSTIYSLFFTLLTSCYYYYYDSIIYNLFFPPLTSCFYYYCYYYYYYYYYHHLRRGEHLSWLEPCNNVFGEIKEAVTNQCVESKRSMFDLMHYYFCCIQVKDQLR